MQFYKRKNSKGEKGKIWWFKFVHRGVRYQESTKLTNKRLAEDYASAFRLRLIEGELNVKRKQAAPKFSAAMAEFLEWSKEQHAEHPNTTLRYTSASKPLLRFFGKSLLDSITPDDVQRYRKQRSKIQSERTDRKLKPATINRELACLRAMFNYFIDLGKIAVNPVSKRRGRRGAFLEENNEQMYVLSHEDEEKYLSEASQPHKDLAILMLETGMRPEEVARIAKSNVHLDKNYIYNPHGKTKAAKRRIPLTARAAAVLRERLEKAKSDYLFPHKNDPSKPMIKVNHAHEGAIRRANLGKFRLYDLRHTFATRAVESGVDLVTLAALLGHSKIQMVMRYAHPTAEHQVNAIKKLEEFTTARKIEEFSTGRPALVN